MTHWVLSGAWQICCVGIGWQHSSHTNLRIEKSVEELINNHQVYCSTPVSLMTICTVDPLSAMTAYSASKNHQCRTHYDISKDRLEHLHTLHFSWVKIARLLRVSISTIQCQRRELYLDDKLKSFSDISDNELDNI